MDLESRLRDNLNNWEKIGAPTTVLEWLREGVPIKFVSKPNHTVLHNPKFSDLHRTFIRGELKRLLEKGAIERCIKKPMFVSPINVVPKKNKKYRLITNLKLLNDHIEKKSFRNEDIRTTIELVESNDDMVSLDLKDCFYHLPVHTMFRDYLGIFFEGKFYRWRVLPFGLCLSPYFCAKIIRPIVIFLRSQYNMKCQVYVDDFFLCGPPNIIEEHRDQLVNTLNDLGWIINYEKSSLTPQKVITFIGFVVDTMTSQSPTLWVAHARIQKLRTALRKLIKAQSCSARSLARVLGQCISMSVAVVYGKIMLRGAYNVLKSRNSWETMVNLDSLALEDLNWWLKEVSGERKRVLEKRTITCHMETDASQTGWGATLDGQQAAGVWNVRLSYEHSNYRELMGIFLGIMSFKEQLKNQSLQILTDNMTARAYLIHQGGPSPKFNKVAKAIWATVASINCHIQVNHLSGVLNIEADTLSRQRDNYNYSLSNSWFKKAEMLFGPHTVDRFADCTNSKLPRYNSLYRDHRSEGVDALAQFNWAKENNYCFPPFRLIQNLLNCIESQGAYATIVAPMWVGQSWYNKLRRMSVADPIVIPNNAVNFERTSRFATPEPARNRRWKVALWRVCGQIN